MFYELTGTLTRGLPFQDVAKAGLVFGDEGECRICVHGPAGNSACLVPADSDPEYEKEQQEILKERFKPLLDYLKKEAQDLVRDGTPLCCCCGGDVC